MIDKIESNRLITHFMNVKITYVELKYFFTPNDKSFWMIEHSSRPVDNLYFNFPSSYISEENCFESYYRCARYAESWEWLMPIIDKIEAMGYTFMYDKQSHDVHVGDDKHMFSSSYVTEIKGNGDSKIASYYDAVCNFIIENNVI